MMEMCQGRGQEYKFSANGWGASHSDREFLKKDDDEIDKSKIPMKW